MAVSDSETDPGYRSRSASRRERRKKQTHGKQNMSSLPEEGQSTEANSQASSGPQSAEAQSSAQEQSSAQAQRSQAPQQAQQEAEAMQPFEHIGPDSTSMDGPVTYARAMRGEIPMRPYVFPLHRVPISPLSYLRVFADCARVGEIRTRSSRPPEEEARRAA